MLEKLSVPSPLVSATLAGCAEFFGGLLIFLGLLTRIATLPVVFNMLVACFTVHKGKFGGQIGGMEYPLTLAVVCAGLGLIGAGRFSVDALLSRNPRELPP